MTSPRRSDLQEVATTRPRDLARQLAGVPEQTHLMSVSQSFSELVAIGMPERHALPERTRAAIE
jgi:hypothetical protein